MMEIEDMMANEIRTLRRPNGNGHDLHEDIPRLQPAESGPQRLNRTTGNPNVDRPAHYVAPNGMEVIDVIEAFNLGFHEGSILQYLLRWRRKGGVEDLQKAQWHLDRFIKKETIS